MQGKTYTIDELLGRLHEVYIPLGTNWETAREFLLTIQKSDSLSPTPQEEECKHQGSGELHRLCAECGEWEQLAVEKSRQPSPSSPTEQLPSIEPLTGFDGGGIIFNGKSLRWIEEKSGHEFVGKINELVKGYTILKEVIERGDTKTATQ